ncbi:50S ribosomal protein L31 ['Catharanthus roseus' aster yellows phytoplasma]|uniref:Large ribosomal subunit protein bL31 n=1 Tax='Catharanthus roseus' aster yellows phytoplasma TaxID=1193712 RepID=A0A4P6MEI7_9MOLU|nr:50S ribosomal protein L31 ['Catharanthus roseus' aster yellows phytoplasma]QBF24051.1 50S ribosomal protein L31 ['Catharanthus roseus' aster yellows phytoplasma]
MKANIHPQFETVEVSCATCGKQHPIGTTVTSIKIETCSNCHPFYTGAQTFVVKAGPIDKFNKRYGITQDQKVKTVLLNADNQKETTEELIKNK